jgi:RHS repeat-associated protein
VYDGLNPVQELSGGAPTANLVTGNLDEYFTRSDAKGTRNLLTDSMRNTIALADSSGNVQTQYSYEPFGKTTISGSANTSALQYVGRENDSAGLYFMRARYYSPTYQRFISEDPVGIGGQSVNFYRYAKNNPISYFDPIGLKPATCSSDGYRDATPAESASALEDATSYDRTPYQLGGTNDDGIDCSNLVATAITESGVNPNFVNNGAANFGVNPGLRPLQPGEQIMPGDVMQFTGHVAFFRPDPNSNIVYGATNHGGVRPGSPLWFGGFIGYYRIRVPCTDSSGGDGSDGEGFGTD